MIRNIRYKNTALFDLIKSLNKSERRYFKLYANLYEKSKKKIFIKIFDFIINQKEYDKASLTKEFSQITNSNYANIKTYLHKLILKSLSSFYQEHTLESQIITNLAIIKVLYAKGLFDQCLVVLNKTKILTKTFANPAYQLLIGNWTLRLNYMMNNQLKNHINAVKVSAKNQYKLLKEFQEMQIFYNKSLPYFSLRDRLHGSKVMFAKFMVDYKTFKQIKLPLAPYSKYLYYYTLLLFKLTNNEYDDLILISGKIIKLLKENPVLGRDELLFPYLGYNSMLIVYDKKSDFKSMKLIINQIRKITRYYFNPTAIKQINGILVSAYVTELSIMYSTFEYKNLEQIEQTMSDIILNKDCDKPIVYSAYHNLSLAHFMIGNFEKALDYFNIITHPMYSDQFGIAVPLIFRIFTHIELGNYLLVDSLIRSTMRRLKSLKLYFKFENALLNGLNKIEYINSKLFKSQLVELRKELSKYENKPFKNQTLEGPEIFLWLDSKIKDIPFRNLMIENTKAHGTN